MVRYARGDSLSKQTSRDSPSSWTGTRTVIQLSEPCGWCSTAHCDGCNHEIGYYEKLWICGCECNKSWVPQAVIVERKGNNETTTRPSPTPVEEEQEEEQEQQEEPEVPIDNEG